MAERKFFICKHCGNIVGMVFDAKVPLVCCGEKNDRAEAQYC